MDVNQIYLESVEKQFLYYKTLGEKAMAQLEPDQWFAAFNEDSNSIATIVKHLWGNMLSRWTDFLTSDGEKPWRNRDAEFENDILSQEELLQKWNEGWDCLLSAIRSVRPDQLTQIVYIRNEGHTVMEAINRQLAHYPYHVGQIIYAAKILKKTDWDSLSIPRNRSYQYNETKFSQDKVVKNFTDDELKRLK
ncbi:MAG: DUF1572 family protein [Paenibacillus macerans]|uniref:DUF1572 domain-containing protein n=1 Tax=Paenibacillus macerans TaxID=44252 RepID=A0A090YD44_PAEMA|nr:DUF1572 family protein [Paenibacillus macerans]KFM95782.1 hypothetical protein DJ90_2172 [Paenibacillus macerans]MCY7558815.1 DUF1572 domain-containing protein [Paenibacillus macerans]MDU7476127.1 DUF1572 family protein [Paenibacillus macerans]MEC0139608.1 DUF1572 family protein [Paenibacillus macerans]MEC0149752.1 DUF1572 family protein [Paenibacillus macerans]